MRLRYVFWLNLNKLDEHALAEKIGELKARRTFSRTIRDGIRLICDLRQGRTDVLAELFPWVLAEPQGLLLEQQHTQPITPTPHPIGTIDHRESDGSGRGVACRECISAAWFGNVHQRGNRR